jgi:hypothetical protein
MNSLESQIQEARLRAELFTKSLQEARLQENISLKTLEEERSRWTKSFEEKSTLIDQLERELSHTVEALHSYNFHRPGQDPHAGSNGARLTFSNHQDQSGHHEIPAESSAYSRPPPPPPTSLHQQSFNSPPRRADGGADNAEYSSREYVEMKSLIVRLQEENIQLAEQLDKTKYDNKLKQHKVEQLESEVRKLDEEKRLQQIAIHDYDGKLNFRVKQVCGSFVMQLRINFCMVKCRYWTTSSRNTKRKSS